MPPLDEWGDDVTTVTEWGMELAAGALWVAAGADCARQQLLKLFCALRGVVAAADGDNKGLLGEVPHLPRPPIPDARRLSDVARGAEAVLLAEHPGFFEEALEPLAEALPVHLK